MALDTFIRGVIGGIGAEVENALKALNIVRPQRSVSGDLAAVNAELVLDVNGDESATIFIDGSGATLTSTYVVEGSVDGLTYYSLLAYPIPQFCVAGTIPAAAQPMALEALSGTSIKRTVCVCVAQLKKIRVRLSAYTTGVASVVINSDDSQSLSPYVRDQKSATLLLTATGAAAAAVTATVPSVAGLRHYIDFIQVIKFNSAALTAAAAPVLVTTTNIPGAPVLNFTAAAEAQGTDVVREMDFGGQGMATTSLGTNTTVVCPATTGVIWRVNISYRLGL